MPNFDLAFTVVPGPVPEVVFHAAESHVVATYLLLAQVRHHHHSISQLPHATRCRTQTVSDSEVYFKMR